MSISVEELTSQLLKDMGDKPAEEKSKRHRLTKDEAARVKRFLSFNAELQEGILQYGEKMRESFPMKT